MGNECSSGNNTYTPWKSNKICTEDPSKFVLTYSVMNNPANLSMDDVEEMIAKAFEKWSMQAIHTNYVYQRASPYEPPEIYINFCDLEKDNDSDDGDKEENHDGKEEEVENNISKPFNKSDAVYISFDMNFGMSTKYSMEICGMKIDDESSGNNDIEADETVDKTTATQKGTENKQNDNNADEAPVDNNLHDDDNYATMTAKLSFDLNIPWIKNIVGQKVNENGIDFYYMALYGIGQILFMGTCEPLKDRNSILSDEYEIPVDSDGNYIEPKLSIEDIDALRKHFSATKDLEQSGSDTGEVQISSMAEIVDTPDWLKDMIIQSNKNNKDDENRNEEEND